MCPLTISHLIHLDTRWWETPLLSSPLLYAVFRSGCVSGALGEQSVISAWSKERLFTKSLCSFSLQDTVLHPRSPTHHICTFYTVMYIQEVKTSKFKTLGTETVNLFSSSQREVALESHWMYSTYSKTLKVESSEQKWLLAARKHLETFRF